jgi:hypothetical protein
MNHVSKAPKRNRGQRHCILTLTRATRRDARLFDRTRNHDARRDDDARAKTRAKHRGTRCRGGTHDDDDDGIDIDACDAGACDDDEDDWETNADARDATNDDGECDDDARGWTPNAWVRGGNAERDGDEEGHGWEIREHEAARVVE